MSEIIRAMLRRDLERRTRLVVCETDRFSEDEWKRLSRAAEPAPEPIWRAVGDVDLTRGETLHIHNG